MKFGEPTDFAIEAYHEPSGPEWHGFGRMCIYIQGKQLGNIRENHSSLFHAVDRFRELQTTIETLWDQSFKTLSDTEIFAAVDSALYVGDQPDWGRYGRFDFLTNTGSRSITLRLSLSATQAASFVCSTSVETAPLIPLSVPCNPFAL